MSIELKNLKQLLTGKSLRIPDYQRGYAWEKEQLEEFWDDLIHIENEKTHYTGTISLEEIDYKIKEEYRSIAWKFTDDDCKLYYVIDGQQRLTTSIILLNELIQYAKDNELKMISNTTFSDCEKHFIIDKGENNAFIFGYEKNNPSFECMTKEILQDKTSEIIGDNTETLYTKNLKIAKEYFKNEIQKYCESDRQNLLSKLYKNLTQRMMFAQYIIENSIDTFITFETMNNRGKQLTTLELLKNRLIYLAVSLVENTDVRDDINKAWKEIYEWLGKKEKLDDEEFLRDHWLIYYGALSTKRKAYRNDLFEKRFNIKSLRGSFDYQENESSNDNFDESYDIDEFIDETEQKNNIYKTEKIKKIKLEDIKNYTIDIGVIVKYWAWTFKYFNDEIKINNIKTDEIKDIIYRLNMIGIRYFRPLVAVILYKLDKDTISLDDAIKLLNKIEKYIFITFVFGGATSRYSQSAFVGFASKFYLDSVSDFSKIEVKLDEIYDTKIQSIQFEAKIKKLFTNNDGFYSWGGCRYLLWEYERWLYGYGDDKNKRGIITLPKEWWSRNTKDSEKTLSIEHIYPQTPKDNDWEVFANYDEKDKKRLNGCIGNLLPLAQSINSSISNGSFEIKKAEYEKGCCAEKEVAQYPVWDENAIYERGKKILDFMKESWNLEFSEEQEYFLIHGQEKLKS